MKYVDWFQRQLKQSGVSLNELHRRTEVARAQLTRINKGRSRPGPDNADCIARYGFGIQNELEIEYSVLLAVGYEPKAGGRMRQ